MERIIQESILDVRIDENGSCIEMSHELTQLKRTQSVTIEKSSIPQLIEVLKKYSE